MMVIGSPPVNGVPVFPVNYPTMGAPPLVPAYRNGFPNGSGYPNGGFPPQPKDECDAFGNLVAEELRRFGSDLFRRKAKRRVQQALIETAEEEEMASSKPCSCTIRRGSTPLRDSLTSQDYNVYGRM